MAYALLLFFRISMEALLYPLIIVAGILQACGNPMNAELKRVCVNPWLASLISFGLILCVFVVIFAMNPKPLPSVSDLEGMPWWAPIGGITGAVAVLLGLLFVNKIGAGTFGGLLITANLVASLAIDHFGLMNMPERSASPGRIIGAILMTGGIYCISKF